MRLLIIGLNYLPESTSIGPYTAELAEYLTQTGNKVQVITGFPMAPQWRVWDGYRGCWFRREKINGVPVLRTFLYVPKRPRRALNRMLFDCSFALSSLIGGLFSGPCDAIFVVSPPLQLGLTGWLLSLIKRARLLVHLQDLVPDAAVATGVLTESSLAVHVGRWMERLVYARADRIGVICDGFARNLTGKGIPPQKVTLLPNSIDLDFMREHPRDGAFRACYGLGPQDFVVMYSGSIALKQGLEVFVDAAARLREETDIDFVLVGEGPYLAELKARAQRLNAHNVRFLPLQPRESLPEQLSAADLLVLAQRRAVTDIVFPGKLLYYMAAGRPILAAVSEDSETGRFVCDNHVGIVVPPEDAAELAAAILSVKRAGSGELGVNSRRTVKAQFDRRTILPRFAETIQNL